MMSGCRDVAMLVGYSLTHFSLPSNPCKQGNFVVHFFFKKIMDRGVGYLMLHVTSMRSFSFWKERHTSTKKNVQAGLRTSSDLRLYSQLPCSFYIFYLQIHFTRQRLVMLQIQCFNGGVRAPINACSVRVTSPKDGKMYLFGGCQFGSGLLENNLYQCDLRTMSFENLTVR